ncbi:MAG: hypothetical protein ABFD25_08190 [Clostridiaceae bacterium]
MIDLLNKFTEEYSLSADRDMSAGDDQRSANNPVLFIFIGDRVSEALSYIHREIGNKWSNSDGILFFHIYSKNKIDMENVFSLKIDCEGLEPQKLRKALNERFGGNDRLLSELSLTIREIKNRILEFGKMYSFWERINLAVVTRADDPLNVILPEITLFAKNRFRDDFKIITADLYTLINEKDENKDYEYSAAAALSFFRELEYMQSGKFNFNKPLEVLSGTKKRLPVTNNNMPVFDLLYLLGDKNYHGIIHGNVQQENYEIIAYINILKNRKINTIYDSEHAEQYNDYQFKNDISTKDGKQAYATAGLSKVKRPNAAIAANVLYHFFNAVLSGMKERVNCEKDSVLKCLRMDEHSIDALLDGILEGIGNTDEMMNLIAFGVPFSQLSSMTLKEAEEALYGDACGRFFAENLEQGAYKRLENMNLQEGITKAVTGEIIENPKYGLFCACEWTGEQGIIEAIRKLRRNNSANLEQLQEELQDICNEPVSNQPFKRLPFFEKTNIRNLKNYLHSSIYGKQLEILKLKLKQKIIDTYESIFEDLHEKLSAECAALADMAGSLRSAAVDRSEETDEYLGQNVFTYYRSVVEEILKGMESNWGKNFYFDERFYGSIHGLIQQGAEQLLARTIDICRKYILSNSRFNESFESELLQRANNVVSSYESRNVLTKEELFEKLYETLDENAAVNCSLFRFTQTHSYEEKYFFGDFYSDFLKYAFACDKGKRTYKLSCVHEKRTSGIEKLNLMGGFHISDMIYVRNCLRYYEAYVNEGFLFHSMEPGLLPEIDCMM